MLLWQRHPKIKLRCIIKSPQNATNLIFSVHHRLLAMTLRRQVLDGIETLDQLFDSTRKYITDEPMTAVALTNYITLRSQKIDYAENLTFYPLGRRVATDLTRKIGHDAARLIMNHDPASRVLEKYYLSLENTMDVSCSCLND
ncbi:hypothetical protein CDV31_007907 [Fusarium ambrosium]|uniref:Uncharacterized protein n=1 Tax=Fusarium ambrosium TaxID=131363 RepID=A0A428U449_9HYPO|nr:hypothetical protein CDV31_007907 [Fusarium ambrosium]